MKSALAPQALLRLSDPALLFFDHSLGLTVTVPSAVNMVDLHRIGALFCGLWEFWGWRRAASWLVRFHTVHHASRATGSQLVDSTDCINGRMQCAPGVEILLDSWQEILFTFGMFPAEISDPRMRQSFVRSHTRCWIDGQTAANELASSQRDAAPVFERCEGVVSNEDSLHFFKVRVAIERSVTAEEEVGDNTNGPDITVHELAVVETQSSRHLHRLSVASLSEDLRRHITRSAAGRSKDMELFFIHDA